MFDFNILFVNFCFEVDVSGFVGSVRFMIIGDDNSMNVENLVFYNVLGGFSLWNLIVGNYMVNVKVYFLLNVVGVLCVEEIIFFFIFLGGIFLVLIILVFDIWAYDCDDNVIIDFYGSGVNCFDNLDVEVIINNIVGVF